MAVTTIMTSTRRDIGVYERVIGIFVLVMVRMVDSTGGVRSRRLLLLFCLVNYHLSPC